MAAPRERFKIQPNCFIWGVSEDLPMIAFPQPMFQTPTYRGIKKLCSGAGVNFMIDDDNKLRSWGKSEVGLLGQDLVTQCSEPTPVKFDGRFIKVAIGTEHVVALTTDGKLVTWGMNTKKQLGRPSDGQISRLPGLIESLANVTMASIAVFDNSSYAISNKGEVFSWGSNQKMELGHSSTSFSVLDPALIGTITQPIKKIVRCGGFFMALCRRESAPVLSSIDEAKMALLTDSLSDDAGEQKEAEEKPKKKKKGKETARSRDESVMSFKSNPDEGKVEYAELLENVTKIITRLKGLYDTLFQIDQAMIFAFQSRGGGTVQGVVNLLHIAGEALEDFSLKEMVSMKENTHLDPNLKDQLVVLEKISFDALNLRKVNYVCGKMFLRCIKLKSNSYEEVRAFVKSKNATMPQKNIIEEFQSFCLKATSKIRDDTIEVESLQQGVNDLTSYA